MSTIDIRDFIAKVDAPRNVEFTREMSVYRYVANTPYDREQIQKGIQASQIQDTEFGILEQLPQNDHYLRTLWAKLGERTQAFVDREGVLVYGQLHRVKLASAVVEFSHDDEGTGLIIFGGGLNIKKELIPFLEKKFQFHDIYQQTLLPDQIRSIFLRYWQNLKKIDIDPSRDNDWGTVSDAKLGSARGTYIDVDAPILQKIHSNEDILIRGFKSEEKNVTVDGLKNGVNVRFDVAPEFVKIAVNDFEVEQNLLSRAEDVFYDLARKVYFAVAGTEKWTYQQPNSNQLSYMYSISSES